ncbi:MAG TPA: hypothetical protein EYQ64_04560 [Gemmatimonadetes bacterium]|nr:hypothetical protein [Gemmatimonadota bacterium]
MRWISIPSYLSALFFAVFGILATAASLRIAFWESAAEIIRLTIVVVVSSTIVVALVAWGNKVRKG